MCFPANSYGGGGGGTETRPATVDVCLGKTLYAPKRSPKIFRPKSIVNIVSSAANRNTSLSSILSLDDV
jgi:hypothetical protein